MTPALRIDTRKLADADTPANSSVPLAPGLMPTPAFEYVGKTGLTVVSPMTGRRYRFERPGAVLEIDPRDRPWMSFVPQLRRR